MAETITALKPAEPGRESPANKPEVARRAPWGGKEFGGPSGREPTRYGDWEKNGRCIDF